MSAAGLAHLIGSVPLATTEDVFRRLSAALGPVLSRMPDGETGERRRWVYWQRTMLERHPAMEVDTEAGLLELRQWDGSLLRRTDLLRFRPGVDPDSVQFPTGYAEAARESWAVFTRLRREGVVPPGLRFQVCLPTAMSSACMYVSPRAHDDYLRVYERSLLGALDDITGAIPHAELSIQWDICQEVLVFENYFPSRPTDYKTRIFALLERLGAAVPADVELGYHLCYGSPADQHLVMPTDAGVLAELTRAIIATVRRPLDFIHLPVPRARTTTTSGSTSAHCSGPSRTSRRPSPTATSASSGTSARRYWCSRTTFRPVPPTTRRGSSPCSSAWAPQCRPTSSSAITSATAARPTSTS